LIWAQPRTWSGGVNTREEPSAPYGYEKGMLSFFEKDNKLEGKVEFGESYKRGSHLSIIRRQRISLLN
jgi:hypothetical protein